MNPARRPTSSRHQPGRQRDSRPTTPGSVREDGGFRLEFHGPLQPELGQGIYRFLIGGRPSEIFIVPIERTADAMKYEAIFF